jgi:hypothetical protein
VTRSRYSSVDFKAQVHWPAWSRWFLKRQVPPLPNPPLGQGEGIRDLPTNCMTHIETFMARKFAGVIVSHDLLAPEAKILRLAIQSSSGPQPRSDSDSGETSLLLARLQLIQQ